MSKKNTAGDQIVTYPPKLTYDLILSMQRPKKKRKRPDNEPDEKDEDTGNSDAYHDSEYEAAVQKQKNLAKLLRK